MYGYKGAYYSIAWIKYIKYINIGKLYIVHIIITKCGYHSYTDGHRVTYNSPEIL